MHAMIYFSEIIDPPWDVHHRWDVHPPWDVQNPPSTTPIQLFYSQYPFTLVHAHKEHTCWVFMWFTFQFRPYLHRWSVNYLSSSKFMPIISFKTSYCILQSIRPACELYKIIIGI